MLKELLLCESHLIEIQTSLSVPTMTMIMPTVRKLEDPLVATVHTLATT